MSDGAVAQTAGGDAGPGQGGEGPDGGGAFDAQAAFQSLQQDMQQGFGQLGERFEAVPPQADTETPEPEAAQDVDLSWLDDPNIDPQAANERLAETVNSLVEQRVQSALQQHVDPLRESLTEERYHREAADLVAEFPEMGTPEVQDKLFNQQTGAAVQLAQQLESPDLARRPAFWRMAYLAHKGMEVAQAEASQSGSEQPAAAHLEGGGGANPGGGQVDLAELITNGGAPKRGGVFG